MSWEKKLKSYLVSLLSNITDTEYIDEIVSDENMKIWEKAFTNETYSQDLNNEELEFVGDAILNTVFSNYLIIYYPDRITLKELNNAKTRYMSGKYQYMLAETLGLHEKGLIRHDSLLSHDSMRYEVVKDMFEGFFGGLYMTSRSISEAFAFDLCLDVLKFSFGEKELKFEETTLNEPTTVQQLFTKFSLGEPKEVFSDVDGRIKFQIILEKKHVDFWNNYLPPEKQIQPGTVIGKSIENVQKTAKANAYSEAIKYLAAHDITTKKAKKIKFQETLKTPMIKNILDKIYSKLALDDFVDFKFKENKKLFENNKIGRILNQNEKPVKTRSLVILYFIGIKSDGSKRIIYQELFDDQSINYINSKYNILMKYLEDNK